MDNLFRWTTSNYYMNTWYQLPNLPFRGSLNTGMKECRNRKNTGIGKDYRCKTEQQGTRNLEDPGLRADLLYWLGGLPRRVEPQPRPAPCHRHRTCCTSSVEPRPAPCHRHSPHRASASPSPHRKLGIKYLQFTVTPTSIYLACQHGPLPSSKSFTPKTLTSTTLYGAANGSTPPLDTWSQTFHIRDHALELLCRRAFLNNRDHVCPPELDKLGKDIVDRCEGLPLAIVSIGGLLSSLPPTSYVWNEMYNQLRSELVNNNNVRAIINLSYHDLPGDLRNCFLYCSMFPEDYPMSRESLVRLWVAEGFAVRKEQSTPEEMAERYLRELIHRNMLEVVENDELGRVSTCKMHDIMRDLALSIAKEERFGSANDYGTMLLMDREYVRRFSTCGWRDNSTPGVTFPCLRTLLSLEAISPSTNMLSSIMSEPNYLTVMELQDSAITELPASVGNLFNLRYIGLRRTLVKSLPESIERLSNLNTLDIKQTKIEKLPRGLVKVKNLRHLFADRFVDEKQSEFRYFIGVQAPKGLSSLEELQTLETVEASKDLAEQLEKLMQLRSIWIDNIRATDCEKLFSALSKMPFLSSLLLSACDENEALCFQTLKPTSTNLHRLIVRGHWATETLQCPIFRDHGKNLKFLALSWCQLGEDALGVLASHVPNLTYLRLNNMHSAETLVLSAVSFPHLKTIVLKHMPDVNQLKIMDGALPVVEGLYIQSLSGLARVPQGIETLYSLKKLWLRDLHQDFKAQWIEDEMHQKMQHVPELRV